VKSNELYQHLRAGLSGWFKSAGFKRAPKAQLGWHDGTVFVWIQCDQWGWDRFAGSSFFVNIQRGGEPVPWNAPTERLQQLLTDAELETARRLQNEVIGKLQPPPPEYVEQLRTAFAKHSQNADGLVDALLTAFRPVDSPYRANQDFSFRYFDEHDVRGWSAFLVNVLPRITERRS